MAILPRKNFEAAVFGMQRSEALEVQQRLINDWEPKSEVWSLKYGHGILGIVAACNGYFINSIFRQKLRLLHNGYLVTSFFLSAGPGAIAAIAHEQLINSKMLLYEVECLPCNGIAAAVALNLTGFVYPLLLAPAISLGIAGNMGYRIPRIFEYKELLKLYWSILKPLSRKLGCLVLANSLFASCVTYKQHQSMKTVTNVLQLIHDDLESSKELNSALNI